MLRLLFWISVVVCGLLGVVHTAVTLPLYGAFSAEAVWFAGTGLGLVVLALLNVAVWSGMHPSRAVRGLTHLVNAVMVVFAHLAVRAVPEPQAYLVLASLFGLLISGVGLDRPAIRRGESGSRAT